LVLASLYDIDNFPMNASQFASTVSSPHPGLAMARQCEPGQVGADGAVIKARSAVDYYFVRSSNHSGVSERRCEFKVGPHELIRV
jgi:hypothetical protein